MIVINFSHPLTDNQKKAIEEIKGRQIDCLIEQMAHLDQAQPFAEQIRAMVDSVGLSSAEWQGKRILIVPPGHAPATAVLMAELHGRMGYFPEIVRIRPSVDGSEPFEVGEIIALRDVRDFARRETRWTQS